MNEMPKFVVSTTLEGPEWNNTFCGGHGLDFAESRWDEADGLGCDPHASSLASPGRTAPTKGAQRGQGDQLPLRQDR
jgi:hypothetical protein